MDDHEAKDFHTALTTQPAESLSREKWAQKLKGWLPGVDEGKIVEYANVLLTNDITDVGALAELQTSDLAELKIVAGHRALILSGANSEREPIVFHHQPERFEFYCGQIGLASDDKDQGFLSWHMWRGFFGEFFASATYCFIVNMIIISSGIVETQDISLTISLQNLSVARYLSISVGAGFAFALVNYTFFPASGGHITPAISFAFLFSKQVSPIRWFVYFIAQFSGALIGTGFANPVQFTNFNAAEGGRNYIQPGYDDGSSTGIEVLTTMILCLTALSFYDKKRPKGDVWFGHLALGFVVLVVHLIALPINGASMNPARSFASCAVARDFSSYQWTYWVGPALGAMVAVVWYEIFLREKAKRE